MIFLDYPILNVLTKFETSQIVVIFTTSSIEKYKNIINHKQSFAIIQKKLKFIQCNHLSRNNENFMKGNERCEHDFRINNYHNTIKKICCRSIIVHQSLITYYVLMEKKLLPICIFSQLIFTFNYKLICIHALCYRSRDTIDGSLFI